MPLSGAPLSAARMPLPPAPLKVYIAAKQCGDRQRAGNDDGFVVEPFFFEKAPGVGDIDGEVIEIGLWNRGADFFGVSEGCREKNHSRDENDKGRTKRDSHILHSISPSSFRASGRELA